MPGGPPIDLVVLSSVHWHFTWQRHHELSTRLAQRGYRVTYCEPIPKRWPGMGEFGRVWGRLRGRHEAAGLLRQRISPGVTLHGATAVPDTGRLTRWLNRRFFIPRAADRLATELGSPLVVLNYLPLAASIDLQQRLRPDLVIYDCVWDWPHDPYSRPGVVREEELVATADLVFADSPYLLERMQQQHARVECVLPAVDYELYAPARAGTGSKAGSSSGRARCAYFGAVGANIDLELLARLSREFELRIIGPVQENLERLAAGTEIVGSVPQRELPALLADVDVLVLPYREAAHSAGVIPAKTFECLATGKPTVAKGLPSLEQFGEQFYLRADADSFVAAVGEALAERPAVRQARLELAERNSWQLRTAQVDALIRHGLEAKVQA